ncbi:MAG TPA: tetratricopeptide repeat protein [Polyangiaceae bacterium]|nr:tetratricopeptide repeat protein [Polyangiaceae bacterium]
MKRLAFVVACLAGFACVGCGGAAPLPPAAIALNENGAKALQEGDLETATARLEVALEYNPEFVEALGNLGLVELARGNFARARQLLERAVRLNPDVVQPHHGLGVLAEREHRPDEASVHYRDALRLDPGFTASRANLGRLLLQAGQVEHALVQFRKLREVAPREIAGVSGLIECLMLLGRHAEARAEFSAVSGEIALSPRLALLQAREWIHTGQVNDARQLLTPLAALRDDYGVAANAWLGVIELTEKRPEAALRRARAGLALDLDHPLTLFVAAVALDELDDPGASAWLQRALRANPNNTELAQRTALRERAAR